MLPPHRLKEVLAKLEGRMIDSIQRVVAYAEQELQTGDEAQFEQTALDLINDFRRSSKTALAMRLLLGEQGHITQPIRLPVAPLELRERVSNMATKEQEVRVKVEGEIIAIRDDSEKLLQTPGLPEPIKAMLNQTVAQMQDNLQHVRSGKGFDALPHPMEILEGSEAQEVEELVESIPLMEVEEVAIEELEVHAVEEEKTGFGTQLNNWLNTPVGVNWEEAAKIKPKEDR